MVYIPFIIIALLVGTDQLIKIWADNNLIGKGSVPFIHFGDTNIINLSYYENTGAAFSIFENKTIFLILITSVFLIFGIWLILAKKIKHKLALLSVTFILAGGIGNLIDRIFRRYVIDYIEVKLFRFAVFNFADCCVVIGAILLAVYVIFFDKSSKEEKKAIENGKV
ncbi:MAG TPA: signal peptidase II [Oscillospiraceae bacterium]|nr:signal peptidase II [Oscillospiraceae bacterium]